MGNDRCGMSSAFMSFVRGQRAIGFALSELEQRRTEDLYPARDEDCSVIQVCAQWFSRAGKPCVLWEKYLQPHELQGIIAHSEPLEALTDSITTAGPESVRSSCLVVSCLSIEDRV